MKLKYIFNINRLSVHKRRFDRGGTYWGYFQMLSTGAILGGVFEIKTWWIYVLGLLIIVSFRYISGYLDDKKGLLKAEQGSYANENPVFKELFRRLDEIESKIDTL
jgi:hypothetical protein